MKKIVLLLLLLLFNNLVYSQDIVYDSIYGNPIYWRAIRKGQSEKLVDFRYENTGTIVRSKVLLSARVWDGLTENVDYWLDSLKSDTMVFEYKTSPPLNMITYRYYYNDSSFYNFIGLRKAELGSDLFTGQYLLICPVIKDSHINIFEGIGANRKILYSINTNDINDTSYKDFNVPEQITFQVIQGTKLILYPKVLNITTYVKDINIKLINIYPNPVSDFITVEMTGNMGVVIRIYNIKPQIVYEEYVLTEKKIIDVSNLPSGIYFLIISDYHKGNIIATKKLMKK
jgi:hypothetical protein